MELLVPVSVGEVLDKITILRIKAKHIKDESKLINIRRELAALEKVCLDKNIALDDQLISKLEGVNQELWNIEDDIRDKERRKEFDERFIALARAVYVTNDQRFRVKAELNAKFGSDLREEKSYKDY